MTKHLYTTPELAKLYGCSRVAMHKRMDIHFPAVIRQVIGTTKVFSIVSMDLLCEILQSTEEQVLLKAKKLKITI